METGDRGEVSGIQIVEGPLSLSVACHIGPGAMAVTCMKKVR